MQHQQQHSHHHSHTQQQQQQQQQRSTFFRANRPGNLMILDESIIENTTHTTQEQTYLSASSTASSTAPNQFNLQQQQQQFTNPTTPNNVSYTIPVQQTQMSYKLHTSNSNQTYLQSQSVSSPQPYMNNNSNLNNGNSVTAQSPRMVPQQPQQLNIVPSSPSTYTTYPSSYTPNRTINATSNNNNATTNNNNNNNNPLSSPFINPPPPPPPPPPPLQPLQYNTVVNTPTTAPTAVPSTIAPPNSAYESYTPCITSAHLVNNNSSKTYFNFDLSQVNGLTSSSAQVPHSPNYVKMNQGVGGGGGSSQMSQPQARQMMTQNSYQMFNNNNNTSTNNANGENQSNCNSNYQKMPHTPLTAVPYNMHHHRHQNNDMHSLNHSLSVPSSPYNFNQYHNQQQQPVFQFNTAMIKSQLQSIQEDSTPSVVRFSNNISINNEISQSTNIGEKKIKRIRFFV
jgi:hypothetical protein